MQPVVRGGGVGVLVKATAVRDAFVRNDGALRHERGHGLGQALGRGRAAGGLRAWARCGNCGLGRVQRLSQGMQGVHRVLLGPRQHVQLGRRRVLGRRHAGVGKKAHRRFGVDEDDVLKPRQRFDGGVHAIGHTL